MRNRGRVLPVWFVLLAVVSLASASAARAHELSVAVAVAANFLSSKRLDQEAVVLSKSAKPQLTQQFLHWLRTDSAAIETTSAAGYALPRS
jgi:hypothetical protein